MKWPLLGTCAIIAGLAACSQDNGCAQAMSVLAQAQAVYDAAATANMVDPAIMAQARSALELAWISVPQFCAERPATMAELLK